MLDTLSLGTTDFALSGENKLVERRDFYPETETTRRIFFYNSNNFYLTVDGRGCRFHFSVPKICGYNSNFFPVSQKDFLTAIQNIEHILRDIGVSLVLAKCKVLRMDLFKNVEANFHFTAYHSVLSSLNLRRTHKKEYQDGYLTHNTLREICFYNKAKEIRENLGPHILRQLGIKKRKHHKG